MDANDLDPDTAAAARMLRALSDCPPEKRLDTLAIVTKVYIEQPLLLVQFATKGKRDAG